MAKHPKLVDPIEARLTARRLALRATALLREAHAIVAAYDPVPGICLDCAMPFEIPAEQVARYEAKGWQLSSCCEGCAAERRRVKQDRTARRLEWEARRSMLIAEVTRIEDGRRTGT